MISPLGKRLCITAGVIPFLCPYATTGTSILPPGYTDLETEETLQSGSPSLHVQITVDLKICQEIGYQNLLYSQTLHHC